MIQMCQLIVSSIGVIITVGLVLLLVNNDKSRLYRGERIEGKHARKGDK